MKKFGFLLVILAVAACTNDKPKDLPGIKLTFIPFYQELFQTHPDSIPYKVPYFIEKHSPFFELFCSHVIKIGYPEEQRLNLLLQQFVSDFRMQTVFNDINKEFADLSLINKQLTNAFRYMKYYFPELLIPRVYYYHGGFNHSIIATDSIIGIGLDKYLGTTYPYYAKLGIPLYQRQKMRKEYIPVDAVRYYLTGFFSFPFEQENVLSHMIYEGEIQYLLKKFFPDTDDTLLFGFTYNQLVWCEKSERSMWQYLIDKKKLFNSDLLEIKRYTQDAPFTTTFPRESPGRAAVWLGYRIVSQFMKKNPQLTPADLIKITDYLHIVQQSEYDP